jgi:DnaD/phage-associated family protein
MNELVEKQGEINQLSDPKTGWLAKSNKLLLSNLNKKLTATQNVLFSLALLHVKMTGEVVKAEFGIDEVIKLTGNAKYERYELKPITRDRTEVSGASINIEANIESDNPLDYIGGTFQVFSDIRYIRGKYHAYFNTTKDEKGFSPILELLKSAENNPLMYNIHTFSKLKSSGQTLYEKILVSSGNKTNNVFLTLEEIKMLFKATGKTMNNFKSLNDKHLSPAIKDINEHTELNVEAIKIKEGRSVVGVELRWSLEKVSLPASEKQLALMNDLYVQMKKHDLVEQKDIKLLEKLENNHLLNSRQAQGVISTALGRVSELEEELKISPITTLDKMADDFDFSEVEKLFPRLSRKNRKKIVKELLDFPEIERRTLLELALDICKQNRAGNVKYLVDVLNEWVIEGVQTRAQALGVHDQNYGELLPDVRHVEASEEFISAMNLWKD